MDCRFCGASNPEGATVCHNCRAPLKEGEIVNPAEKKTSKLATTAFILGLLCLTCVAWPLLFLPAIVLGILALVQIHADREHLKGAGLAVTGILIPAIMVVLAPIFMILVSILLPALGQARGTAQQMVCRTNLQTLSAAMMSYSLEFDSLPTPGQWTDLLVEYEDVDPKTFVCPRDASSSDASYAMNEYLADLPAGDVPPNTVLLFEADLGPNAAGGPQDVALRHAARGRRGAHILFADGSTEFVREDAIPRLLWNPEDTP